MFRINIQSVVNDETHPTPILLKNLPTISYNTGFSYNERSWKKDGPEAVISDKLGGFKILIYNL